MKNRYLILAVIFLISSSCSSNDASKTEKVNDITSEVQNSKIKDFRIKYKEYHSNIQQHLFKLNIGYDEIIDLESLNDGDYYGQLLGIYNLYFQNIDGKTTSESDANWSKLEKVSKELEKLTQENNITRFNCCS